MHKCTHRAEIPPPERALKKAKTEIDDAGTKRGFAKQTPTHRSEYCLRSEISVRTQDVARVTAVVPAGRAEAGLAQHCSPAMNRRDRSTSPVLKPHTTIESFHQYPETGVAAQDAHVDEVLSRPIRATQPAQQAK